MKDSESNGCSEELLGRKQSAPGGRVISKEDKQTGITKEMGENKKCVMFWKSREENILKGRDTMTNANIYQILTMTLDCE